MIKKLFQNKKIKTAVIAALCFVLAVGLATLTVNLIVVGTTSGNMIEIIPNDGFDVAVVFGAKVHKGGALSHMLRDRMDTAIALYKDNLVEQLLLSGDDSGEWGEVTYMKKYAIENGVSEDDILCDGEGYSTIETVTRAKDIFGLEKCVLVTQEYHLYRAMYIAESNGMEAAGVSADLHVYAGQFMRDAREVLARVKDFLLCMVK